MPWNTGDRTHTSSLSFTAKISRRIISCVGALFGIGLGFGFGWSLGGLSGNGVAWPQLFATGDLLLTIFAAPVLDLALTGIASWVPAVMAARQDPAVVLQGG